MREMAELCRILLPANPDLEVANCHVVVSGSTQRETADLRMEPLPHGGDAKSHNKTPPVLR